MTHFHSSSISGTLKCAVNLFPSSLSLNLYWRFALWNFRAGRRKVGHISLDTFWAVRQKEPLCNKLSSGMNMGRQQSSLLQSETRHLCSTSTSYTTPNAHFPDEHPFWAPTANTWSKEFSEAEFAILVLAVTRHSFPWFPTSSFGSEEFVCLPRDLLQHSRHQISGRGSVANILKMCRWFITQD